MTSRNLLENNIMLRLNRFMNKLNEHEQHIRRHVGHVGQHYRFCYNNTTAVISFTKYLYN